MFLPGSVLQGELSRETTEMNTFSTANTLYEASNASSDDSDTMDTEERFILISEIEELQEICEKLQVAHDNVEEDARKSQKAQVMCWESVRRHVEVAEEARKMAETTRQENGQLVAKITKLEGWTDCFEEGEARLTMRKLYQDVSYWVEKHYGCCPTEIPSTPWDIEDLSSDPSDQTLNQMKILSEVHADLFQHIFQSILARFMIGLDESFGDPLFQIDREIQKTCMLSCNPSK